MEETASMNSMTSATRLKMEAVAKTTIAPVQNPQTEVDALTLHLKDSKRVPIILNLLLPPNVISHIG